MKALILAGGFGTRLKSIVSDVPKPMALIAGKPFLEHQILLLKESGITDIVLAIHHLGDKIKSYFGDGRFWKVNITYSEEESPLGTAGAILNAKEHIGEEFIVLNGDTYSPINLKHFINLHKTSNHEYTMSLAKVSDASERGVVGLHNNKVTEFIEKQSMSEGIINRGVYILNSSIFDFIKPNTKFSLELEVFPELAKQGLLHGYVDDAYFIDIGLPSTYQKFKADTIDKLIVREDSQIKDVMNNLIKNGINLALVSNRNKELLGVLNDRIIKEYLMAGGHINDLSGDAMIKDPLVARDTDSSEKIKEILLSGTNHLPILDENNKIKDVEFRVEKIKEEIYPIIRGRAPLRVSFSGGGTDVPHFFEKYGGVVISSTINKYCHATIKKRADSKIIINSDINNREDLYITDITDMKYDGNFDLIKAIIKLTNPGFGFELYLHNDIPPGRGLGSSASFSILLVSLISKMQNLNYDPYKIAEIAFDAERKELSIEGGWQDQYAAIMGGFNFMEFNKDARIVYPLRLNSEIINELNERIILCFVGSSHDSGELHEEQRKNFEQNENNICESLNENKEIAIGIKNCLLTNNFEDIGSLLHRSWKNKKKLSSGISNPNIDSLYETGLIAGATGGKLLGAGAGGYILFYFSPEKRNKIKRALQNKGGEVIDFKFESSGVETWVLK